MEPEAKKLTAQRVQVLLRQQGRKVSLEEAEKIAAFLNMLARITVERWLEFGEV